MADLSPRALEVIRQEAWKVHMALDIILAALNENAKPCDHCGLKVKESFLDVQTAENIRSFKTKLRRWESGR